MIRLRTSTLEEFRRVVDTDYGDEGQLVERVRRGQWADGPASEIMRAGTAWNDVIDRPVATAVIRFDKEGQPVQMHQSGGFSFDSSAVAAANRHVGPGIRQVTGRKMIGNAQVEGTVDVIHGLHIQDHKAKFSTPDARDYEHSLQWRFYLTIHDGVSFRYNLFDFTDPKDGYCRLKDIVSFSFWPYAGMEDECRRWVGRFLGWAEERGLMAHLRPQGERAA